MLLVGGLLVAGCGEDSKPAPTAGPSPGTLPQAAAPSAEGARSGDATRGRQVFIAQCVSCHNSDPSKDGPLGPAVKGSSRALLEARVLHATYPPGYAPKRDSKVMPARPDLRESIPDLAAYLR